ncbi:MAG: hypothetical protein QNJ34_26035 [Xenococcaceae cyanobacterium MO_188.B29]|nr:hypothetical protein [Xenococcaceae cyanobacterium MO_188.B29]
MKTQIQPMKIKFFSLLAVVTTIGITATPVVAQINSSPLAKPNSVLAQNLPMEEGLNLSVEQKEQIQQIQENTAGQINSILNPEQQKQFQSLRGDRSNLRANIQKLNLTNTQRSQIREIMNSSRQEMSQILTDEQKQVLQERVQQR